MAKLSYYGILILLLFSCCTNKFSIQKRKYTGGYYFARSGDRKHTQNPIKKRMVFSISDLQNDSTKTSVSSLAQASEPDILELDYKTQYGTDLLTKDSRKLRQHTTARKRVVKLQHSLLKREQRKSSTVCHESNIDNWYYGGQEYLWVSLLVTVVIVFLMVDEGIISFSVITIAAFVALVIAFIIALVLLLNNVQKG